jgi:hypothetical protein
MVCSGANPAFGGKKPPSNRLRHGTKERDHLEDQGVDGRMGSKWTLGRLVGGCGVDSPGSGYGPVAGSCECGDEPSTSGATGLVS